ncbi:hypothetical protein COL5a_009614 [Colletotrichum fioriniae]|nr:uncharacterized protein COL516b_009877 [Colletotrichum fioriniae]KAJ0298495.1 hypothetical protein COL516b_009877 [Colletotrichum fioriniae]KAJ0320759.1 hypothetical protein COL5a_009614 [Colletotrichum fioriniae]
MEHNNNREDKKSSKGKKPNRRPWEKRSTCRHFLEARCTYGKANCNFPHREEELRPEMVEAAFHQEEEVALAEARYNNAVYSSHVTYNSGLCVNGHYVNHGHYTSNGHHTNNGAHNHHRQQQHQQASPLPQWVGCHIPNPMPDTLGRPTFDGTQAESTSYLDSPLPPYVGPSSLAGPSHPVHPPPGNGPLGPYYDPPYHVSHVGHGYAGPSFPPPDPMGVNWQPTHLYPDHHHHHYQPRPVSPPPGFGTGPSNVLAPSPGFGPGPGSVDYPLSPSLAPPNPHHSSGLELAPAEASFSPAPEQAPVPNTAPAAVVAGAQDPSTIQCWYGLGCKRPGCHFRHDGGRDGHVDNGEASGSGSANANGDGDEGYEGDGDDVSMSESSGSMYGPPLPASEQSYGAATPQSSPRQLPDSVAGDVTPPSPEHTSEEYSAEEGDAEQPAAEEETPKAKHPEEESPQDEEGGQLSTVEETPEELLSEEHSSQEEPAEPPPSSGEKKEEKETSAAAPQQPAARRPGPVIVDGRSARGLGLVKVQGKQESV